MTCWIEGNGSILVHCPPFTICDSINKQCLSSGIWGGLLILAGILIIIGFYWLLRKRLDKGGEVTKNERKD